MTRKLFIIAAFTVAVCLTAGALAAGAQSRQVVLGSKRFAGRTGAGWGTARPVKLYDGGDLSGMIARIHWLQWGGKTAAGRGLNWIFKPRGEMYANPVRIELRAFDLGRCTTSGPLAYRKLDVREPAKPGGPLGGWHPWGGAESICVTPKILTHRRLAP